MEQSRFSKHAIRVFYFGFGLLFLWITVNTVFFNMHFSYAVLPVLILSVLWCAAFLAGYLLLQRHAAFLARNEKKLLLGFFVLLFAVQAFFYWQLASYPTRDLERVFRSAYNYAIAGVVQEPYLDYFYKHPNNLPAMITLQYFFRIFRRFGFDSLEAFIALGSALNGVCVAAAYGFLYLCVKKLFSLAAGFASLGIMLLCLPLQTLISVFYTDTTTMWCAPLILYFYLHLCDMPLRGKAWGCLCVMCAAAAFGANIKYSAVFMLLAVCAAMLLRHKWKLLAVTAAAFAVFFFAFSTGFDAFTYKHVLEKEKADDRATPMSSYIMMGLAGDGAFNVQDRQFAWAFETKQEKEQAIRQAIAQRLRAFTPGSFMAFLNQKNIRSFGSGNMEYDFTVANSPMRQSFLVECVSKGGRYYTRFGVLIQGYHVAVLALVAAAGFFAFVKKEYKLFPILLSVFGLFVFLLFWEASQRYLVNYYMVFIMAAVFSLSCIAGRLVPGCKKKL